MNSRKQSRIIMFALLMAVFGMALYFLGEGILQMAGLLLISMSFTLYGADAMVKYKMTKKAMFLIMAIFFYILVAVGFYMAMKLMN